MRRMISFVLLAGIIVLSLAGCGGPSSPPGDTLTDAERDQLYNVFSSENGWGESINFYMEVFGGYTETKKTAEFKTALDRLTKSFSRPTSAATTKGIQGIQSWSGPDGDGWYTYTDSHIVTPPDGDYTETEILKFRYFAASYRLEFQMTFTASDLPGVIMGNKGHVVFSGNPLGLDPVYPTDLSIYSSTKGPNETYPNKTDELGLKLAFTNISLVSLSSVDALFPEIVVGNINFYLTWVFADDGLADLRDKLMFNVSSSVNGPTTDTPTLHVTGSQDADGNPWTSGTTSFNMTYDLYSTS